MSEEEDTYCRLCAEPTPKTQLISPDEDVAISSKVATKLQWINIDVSPSNTLPKTICFSCFDLLERTWFFLHNARTAQLKLSVIFPSKQTLNSADSVLKNEDIPLSLIGRPVDENWEAFQQLKQEIKIEVVDGNDVQSKEDVKIEHDSDQDLLVARVDCDNIDSANSTDSDVPLDVTAKRKRLKRKNKKYEDSLSLANEKPIDPLPDSITWDNQMCRCAKCDAQCENIASLQVHSLQIHNRCCAYKCLDCDKVVHRFKAFVKHVRTHKEYLRYCCEFCNHLFTLTSNVQIHKAKVHNGAFLTKCRNCGAEFDTPEQLQEHTILYNKRHKRLSSQREIEFDLKCKDCNKEFKSRSNLQQHRQVHKERTRDFSCHVCGKMFFTKGTLGTHMLTHEDSKPFKCPYCPLAFRARGNLTSHISLHSGVKPFVCEQCGKSFRVKRHLKSHSIVHTDLMPFVCEYCNKSFRFKTRLNLHLRQHTGAKPYKCLFCQRDFTNGSNFKKHMKRRHGIDTSRKFEQRVELKDVRVTSEPEKML
ncbi:zinc finger protein 714-like [Colias croceus]|uniref:zinc finger protein 714-like n=1 Tax=Colias crocea TaxID=72248 RepID=UPI001E27E6D8|nr:zinc finger protein 714-like [Colias croceus]